MKNFYNTLAIDKNATVAEIKKAYKKLMLENHPDRTRENFDESLFKEIQQAYEMLCDTNVRIAYNKYISVDGFANETDMFLQLHERYNIFQQFHKDNIEYYIKFKNSYIELYEFVDIDYAICIFRIIIIFWNMYNFQIMLIFICYIEN